MPALFHTQGEGAGGVAALVAAKGLAQISDPAALEAIVDGVLAASPKQLELYRGGKTKLQGYFVGCDAQSHMAHIHVGRLVPFAAFVCSGLLNHGDKAKLQFNSARCGAL